MRNPGKDLISRVTGEVGFQDRLVGYRMGERSGSLRTTLYSFREVVDFLGHGLPHIRFDDLETWVRCTMGDPELARGIADAVRDEPTDYDRTRRIRALMAQRLAQCERGTDNGREREKGEGSERQA